jgi:Na+-driven multidrug efflux pump
MELLTDNQGVVPLIGYNYTAKNYARMIKAIVTNYILILSFDLSSPYVVYCSYPIVKFIMMMRSRWNTQIFQRNICISDPAFS